MATSFHVSGGQIIDPNGQPFTARGINIYSWELAEHGVSAVTSTFPGINFVRVNIFDLNGNTASALQSEVQQLTNQGIVIELEDHNFPNVLTGSDLTTAANWYAGLAAAFKDNPYVWFGTQNEPNPYSGNVQDEITAVYQAVRGAGNNSIVMVNQDTPNGLDLSGMSNVVWDQHFYNNNPNSSNVTDVQASLDRQVSADVATDNIPVIIGEYGVASGSYGAQDDPSGDLAVQVVDQSGFGCAAWAWTSGDPSFPILLNSASGDPSQGLTQFGQEVEQYIAKGASYGGGGTPSSSTVGTGPDSLVLDITEDAYDGNAQFTIAIDGKQLGGAFTALGSHAAGTEQTFTFNGYFGTGNHTVTADFLNDAYGGPGLDRNLYIDSVTYKGVNTNQSAALYSDGSQKFAISGGTAMPAQSPDGTKITTASASPIVDKSGNAWSLVQSTSSGLQIAVNGTVDPVTQNVVLLEALGGNMVQENTSSIWYSEADPAGPWAPIAAPALASSPDGTTITSAAASPIIDKSGTVWSLVQSASSGLQIAVNGTVDPVTQNVVLLKTLNGNMVQENTSGNWYSEAGPAGPWALIAAPAPASVSTGSGSDTLMLSISEDAYANGDGTSDALGDAAFTVSLDGRQLAGTFFASALHSAGTSQNFTFKGDWASGAHTVMANFLNDAWAGTPSTDRNLYVNAIAYDGTDTKQSSPFYATGTKSFSVTDITALPATVFGGGSDTLMLKVSEDAYLGNAQFTVSVDGRQLGGTLTATTLHSSGGSQSFAFKGDFGSGAHTVAVNFLNDRYAGTPATDRNLYVNDIVYNGTDTHLSAALMSAGAKTFSVSGGTTPSVSETSDHGSLQKDLSQTGTYGVGGDTFVLTAGNVASLTLGSGASQVKFVGPSSASLTAGSGQATVTADAGNNKFVAGTGSLDVTGGVGKDAYVFHATGGLLTVEDFSVAKGDTLTVDKALQVTLHQATDGRGGTMLSFGSDTSHGVDIRGVASVPSSDILWA